MDDLFKAILEFIISSIGLYICGTIVLTLMGII